jgi:hypothetical protein
MMSERSIVPMYAWRRSNEPLFRSLYLLTRVRGLFAPPMTVRTRPAREESCKNVNEI